MTTPYNAGPANRRRVGRRRPNWDRYAQRLRELGATDEQIATAAIDWAQMSVDQQRAAQRLDDHRLALQFVSTGPEPEVLGGETPPEQPDNAVAIGAMGDEYQTEEAPLEVTAPADSMMGGRTWAEHQALAGTYEGLGDDERAELLAEVSAQRNANGVERWVEVDPEVRAPIALEAESARAKPRRTVLTFLDKMMGS